MNSFLSPTIDLQKAIVGAAEINRLNEYVSDFSAQETEEPKTIFTLANCLLLTLLKYQACLIRSCLPQGKQQLPASRIAVNQHGAGNLPCQS